VQPVCSHTVMSGDAAVTHRPVASDREPNAGTMNSAAAKGSVSRFRWAASAWYLPAEALLANSCALINEAWGGPG
jgi:hypothetical protein